MCYYHSLPLRFAIKKARIKVLVLQTANYHAAEGQKFGKSSEV